MSQVATRAMEPATPKDPIVLQATVNLLGLSPSKMRQFFESLGEKPFRAGQALQWIHQMGEADFNNWTNMSKALRQKLMAVATIDLPEVLYHQTSEDGTSKWVMRMRGGSSVETVFIPEGERGTLCVSSQIGCALDCSFCSTGKQGFNRDLSAAEIIGQLFVAVKSLREASQNSIVNAQDSSSKEQRTKTKKQRQVTNVVMMGMGEPLLNFDNVVDAMELMMDDFSYGLSKRRVTLSTSGVVPALYRLAGVTDVSLAISLHAPNDELRSQLVPLNKKYPIQELLKACHHYLSSLADRRKITIEYTLIQGINDQLTHADELAHCLKDLPCKINLIPFNPFPHSGYERPSNNQVRRFQNRLIEAGYTVTVRTTRGDDIDAACGQLVGMVADRTKRQQRYSQQRSGQSL